MTNKNNFLNLVKKIAESAANSEAVPPEDMKELISVLTSPRRGLKNAEIRDTFFTAFNDKLNKYGDAEKQIMREVRNYPGAWNQELISVRKIRDKLNLPKKVFDDAVISLSCQDLIMLHKHVYPEQARLEGTINNLVADGEGHYYMGIVLT